MVDVINSETLKEVRVGTRINDFEFPKEIGKQIIPVIEVNPKLLKYSRNINFTERTSATGASPGVSIYTTDANKDTFITGVQIANASSAACDNTLIRVRGTAATGETIYLIVLIKLTLVAYTGSQYVEFSRPVNLGRNTSVYLLDNYTAGASTTNVILYGYEEENSKS